MMKNNIVAYSTGQVAKICNVTKATVWNWIRGGKLNAYQTPGSRFMVRKRILLQFLKKHNMPVPVELHDTDKRKVLIVDDEKSVVDLISRKFLVETSRYEIETAMDGYEAGKKVAIFNPDVVLLDLKMPGLDGFQVCKDIKNNPMTVGIKVIAITGLPDEESIDRIIDCGAEACFKKPLPLDDLKGLVDFLLFPEEVMNAEVPSEIG